MAFEFPLILVHEAYICCNWGKIFWHEIAIKAIFDNIKAPFELNLEKDFFSQDYHQDIFFYVYSNISKKIIAQGGGYQYKKNIKLLHERL